MPSSHNTTPKCESEYPEHERLHKVRDQSQACGEFVEWLESEKRVVLAKNHIHGPGCDGWDTERRKINFRSDGPKCDLKDNELIPAQLVLKELLAEFFSIDLKRLEKEKVKILEEQRKLNERTG